MRNLVCLDPKMSHFGLGRVMKSSSRTCFCKGSWESERELEVKLETEILEFMKGSEKPRTFPTKAELVEAGRKDLVEAIVKKRGWFSMGWDLEEEEIDIEGVKNKREKSEENGKVGSDCDEVVRGFIETVESFGEGTSSVSTSFSHGSSFSLESFVLCSEMIDEEGDTRAEGILTRLEKQRNLMFSSDLGKQPLSRCNSDDWLIEASGEVVLIQKGDANHSHIQTRLQQLELQLVSTLCSLRSKREELNPEKSDEGLTDMQKLSDALEFQETDIINSKDSLRSIRAKSAILEGKRILATIDARKKIYEKQKKIKNARRALQLLRDTSVVWPKSASEVFLVGSFDGWSTQRRMMKSSSGIFSVDLKLYPGKYEIKFIVDGVSKVDPLRPIVKNGAYENNLFLVT